MGLRLVASISSIESISPIGLFDVYMPRSQHLPINITSCDADHVLNQSPLITPMGPEGGNVASLKRHIVLNINVPVTQSPI